MAKGTVESVTCDVKQDDVLCGKPASDVCSGCRRDLCGEHVEMTVQTRTRGLLAKFCASCAKKVQIPQPAK